MRMRSRLLGAAMVEFIVVAPVLTMIGLGTLQYGRLFFAKNQINHASFMAARAGASGNADLNKVRDAYVRALIPVYGGGTSSAELTASYNAALADVQHNTRIELLNPTKESFDDWSDPALQALLNTTHRVIPNGSLDQRSPTDIRPNSGQNIQDANIIKLRITHGVEPKIPFIKTVYKLYLKWLDPGGDSFRSELIENGRIPVVTHVSMQMHSDAFEPDNPVSVPGPGNGGTPADPGTPPVVNTPPPKCPTVGCGTLDPGGGGDIPGSCTGSLPAAAS